MKNRILRLFLWRKLLPCCGLTGDPPPIPHGGWLDLTSSLRRRVLREARTSYVFLEVVNCQQTGTALLSRKSQSQIGQEGELFGSTAKEK